MSNVSTIISREKRMAVSSESGSATGAPPRGEYLFGKRTTMRVFSLFFLMMILDFADRRIVADGQLADASEHVSDDQLAGHPGHGVRSG